MDRFLASCREINRFSVSKIGPEPAKPTISLALITTMPVKAKVVSLFLV